MSPHARSAVLWAPQIFGILLTAFVALFALDSFDSRSFVQALPDFAMHLIPAALVGVAVVLGLRFPWVGAGVALALAIAYAVMVRGRADWILVISGPLALLAVLFALSATVGQRNASNLRTRY